MNDIKIKVKKSDMVYTECKQKISSVYGVSCRDNRILTKTNKRYGIAKRGKAYARGVKNE